MLISNLELFNFYLKYFLVLLENKCIISYNKITDISLIKFENT